MRVLIPGRYGEENPKWLARIELTDHFVVVSIPISTLFVHYKRRGKCSSKPKGEAEWYIMH
jgi:DMSO/TMAO reductase YedYZ molybdopterin-dependent catalytic subunit